MIIRSAVFSASSPGMLSTRVGLIVPSSPMANSTVHCEAVMPRQDLAQLRQGFFRSILLVAADQHDMFALSRSLRSLIDDPWVGCRGLRPQARQAASNDPANSTVTRARFDHGETSSRWGQSMRGR